MKVTDECAVCKQLMTRGDLKYSSNCMHLFHSKCIEASLQNDVRCPLCRSTITSNDLTGYVRRQNAVTLKEDRRRIVECSNRGENWVALAKTLGVKYKTAYSWIRSGEYETPGKGGKKPKILSEDMIQNVIEWLEEDCEMTLKQIKVKLL